MNILMYTRNGQNHYVKSDTILSAKDTLIAFGPLASIRDAFLLNSHKEKKKEFVIKDDEAIAISDVDITGYNLVGDGVLFDRKSDYGDIPKAFLATKHLWHKVEDIAYLTPKYLKESENYYR